ncbi:hypothetical protein NQ317_016324 [Molorchus minor]|uniref:Uncharacterized protein n=1 Tax=Molorchus minor TaxID=1323400 RepID=A0ABQ9J3D7_9CUCU|nr:hypothetical protein NQ317_016324 [Molorchus minor]
MRPSTKKRTKYSSSLNSEEQKDTFDNARGRDGYYSEQSRERGGETVHNRRQGHRSDYTRSGDYRLEPSAPSPTSSHVSGSSRATNVSDSYFRSSGSSSSSSTDNSSTHHLSSPYIRRDSVLSIEKHNELLNSLKDRVLDKLNKSGLRKKIDKK